MSDDYDSDDHGYSLEDVCNRLDKIESSVSEINRGFGWVAILIFGWLALAGFADMWNSKIRYSYWYKVNYDQVTIDKEPADCNFFHAPLGGKGCDYKRQVSVIRFRTDGRNPTKHYISFDDGKTWTDYDSLPTEPQVRVTWNKVED